MNMKTSAAYILAFALLLTGCNNGGSDWDGNIDLAPDPIETEGGISVDGLRKADMTPFIMPREGTKEYDHYNSLLRTEEVCFPGRLYLQGRTYEGEVIVRLSNTIFREGTGLLQAQPGERRLIFAVAITEDGDSLMKVDKETGQETVMYHAEGGVISRMVCDQYGEFICFTIGRKVLLLNTCTNEVEVIGECEGSIMTLRSSHSSFIWMDSKGKSFGYSLVESEENDTTTDEHQHHERYDYTYRPQEDQPEIFDLYLCCLDSEDEVLLLENITKAVYPWVPMGSVVYTDLVQVENKYIASVNIRNGDIEQVYSAVSGDMELLGAASMTDDSSGKDYINGFFVREEDYVIWVDGRNFTATPQFRLENGLLENDSGECEFYCAPFAQLSNEIPAEYFGDSFDRDDFYICDECDNDYCIWADGNGDYYWYHPHSGENEEIEFTVCSRLPFAFISKRD